MAAPPDIILKDRLINFMFTATIADRLGPAAAAKQPYLMVLPPLCFTNGMIF